MATIGAIPSPPPRWASEIVECSSIINRTITIQNLPIENSEFIILNGAVLTIGTNYDYTISNKTITFNTSVLTQTGHVLVKYSFA